VSNSVNIMQLTPSRLELLLSGESIGEALSQVKSLMIGGEAFPETLLRDLKSTYSGRIFNMYGPTETTIWSMVKELTETDQITIGRPIANTQIYILDKQQELMPIGTKGELYIGGDGLARGYWGNAEMTVSRYLKFPFGEGLVYKTGDVARWLPNGEVAYLGREDYQLKVRGFRIEAGEIEHQMRNIDGIKEAVVVVTSNDNDKFLVSYYVSEEAMEAQDLRELLLKDLPEYMVPHHFIHLEVLPLTPNGKLDRKALPDPSNLSLSSGVEYVAPRNDLEEQLAGIWQEILKKEQVGIYDDFFALGGHSLVALRLSNEYHKVLSVKLSLQDLFEHKNVAAHAQLISASSKEAMMKIDNLGVWPNYDISDAQRRVYVLSQYEEASVAYNQPVSKIINGEYDPELIQKAVEATISRHEILRTVFLEDDNGEVKQWVLNLEDTRFKVVYSDLREEQERLLKANEYIATDALKAFDLANGPLLRVALFHLEDEQFVLYFNMHYIVGDKRSTEVFFEEVLTFYEAHKDDKTPALQDLSNQYKDIASWQLEQLKNGEYEQHRQYWLENLSGNLPALELPSDIVRPKVKTYTGKSLESYLDKDTT
ncbi:MAG: condensation domain-containing protein, partial [Cyclobacteriaceae bacterium]